ncbi:MAG: hypothetical protein ACJAYU_005006, partial [Bradymonadia bacterium]
MTELISVSDNIETDVPGSGLRAHWHRPCCENDRNR